MPCDDCPRGCASRGPGSYCGIDRPGRIHWWGVTLLEEHEISPTCEIWFTGCSLRCRFCTVPDAIYTPDEGAWLAPEDLASALAGPEVPPFRAISLVGGDPSVSWPYVVELVPVLRRRFPSTDLVFNTNLYFSAARAREVAATFDWVVGDLHFDGAACAGALAGARDYPEVAKAAAAALLQAGGRLILRILVLPGHVDCCARPSVGFAAALHAQVRGGGRGDLRLHVMTHYAPVGRARGGPLGRSLTEAEVAAARALHPPEVPGPAREPLGVPPLRPPEARDPAVPLEVDAEGRLFAPFVTGDLLPVLAELSPELRSRLVYR